MKGQRYRHVKRGTVYEVLGLCAIQDATSDYDGEKAVLYFDARHQHKLWCRPLKEFLDGRFERVS